MYGKYWLIEIDYASFSPNLINAGLAFGAPRLCPDLPCLNQPTTMAQLALWQAG